MDANTLIRKYLLGEATAEESHEVWRNTEDHLTGISLSEVPRDCTVVWDDVRAWIKGETPPTLTMELSDGDSIVQELFIDRHWLSFR